MPCSTVIRRPGCHGSEMIQWLRLGCNTPSFRERFEHQITLLRRVVNVCREKLGYKALENKLPESIVCKRECHDEVRAWLRPFLSPHPFLSFALLLTHLHRRQARQLKIQTLGRHGYLTHCSFKDISVGDLLDVRVYIDITFTRGPDSIPRHSIHLAFDEIVLVSTQRKVMKVSTSLTSILFQIDGY